MSEKPKLFSEQLRAAIVTAPMTRYRIAVDTGVSEAVLSRFVNSSAGLSMETVDTLCDYLDLKLVSRKAHENKGKKGA